MEKPQHIRAARPSDEEDLYDLLCMAYSENAVFKMSEKKVRAMIEAGTRDRNVVIGVAESPDGKIAGSIGAIFSQWWFTDEWHIDECWNFVHPDYRRSDIRYGAELIKYAKWIADNMQMPLHMGIITTERMEAKIKMYKRQMPQTGAFFMYNMKSAGGPLSRSSVALAEV